MCFSPSIASSRSGGRSCSIPRPAGRGARRSLWRWPAPLRWTGGGCARAAAKPRTWGSDSRLRARVQRQRARPQRRAKSNKRPMILPLTIWSVTEPVLTPGSLRTRFKEWVPCASLANLGNDMMCALGGCTDSRLSQVTTAWAMPEKANQNSSEQKRVGFRPQRGASLRARKPAPLLVYLATARSKDSKPSDLNSVKNKK
jgi:hypothetical protein